MALPKIIEYLLTLQRPDGGHIVQHGINQLDTIIPPLQKVTINQIPYSNEFIDIVYFFAFDPSMVPDAFYAWSMIEGMRTYEGIMSEWWLNNATIDSWVVITQNMPITALLENRTPLNQYYKGRAAFVSIASKEDNDLVIKELNRARSDTSLAEQATKLLSDIKNAIEKLSKMPATGGR
jgi:hypothetical protein